MNQLTNIGKSVLQGFFDSIRGTAVVFYLDKEVNKKNQSQSAYQQQVLANDTSTNQRNRNSKNESAKKQPEESKVLKRVLNCCMLNGGVFWASIILFKYGLLPGLNILLTFLFDKNSGSGAYVWSWMQPFLEVMFGMIWVLPLFLLSRVVNSLWFQDIADSAYKFRKGRPQLMPSISKLIADTLFSLVVQALFLLQSMLVSLIPIYYVGSILSFVHMCLLYSLYSFEYKWFNMGWELHKRLTCIEQNWPYFIGFGMPLAILTQLPNSYIISGCVFAILFPFFILSGNEATPSTNVCDFPLNLFSPVVAISNRLFSKSVKAPVASKIESASPSVSPSHMQAADFTPSLVHRSVSHRNSPSSSSSHRSSTNNTALYRNTSSINARGGSVTSRS